MGALPTGVDITPAQLENARRYQREFGIDFPLFEASAEATGLDSGAFDLAFSEYGASIWCDPYAWIPEASRLLAQEGRLIFLRNATLQMLCMPDVGAATNTLQRSQFGMHRLDWDDDGSVEFHLPHGELLRLLRREGFEVEDLIEIQPPESTEETRFEFVTLEWAKRWPSEEIWVARKRS